MARRPRRRWRAFSPISNYLRSYIRYRFCFRTFARHASTSLLASVSLALIAEAALVPRACDTMNRGASSYAAVLAAILLSPVVASADHELPRAPCACQFVRFNARVHPARCGRTAKWTSASGSVRLPAYGPSAVCTRGDPGGRPGPHTFPSALPMYSGLSDGANSCLFSEEWPVRSQAKRVTASEKNITSAPIRHCRRKVVCPRRNGWGESRTPTRLAPGRRRRRRARPAAPGGRTPGPWPRPPALFRRRAALGPVHGPPFEAPESWSRLPATSRPHGISPCPGPPLSSRPPTTIRLGARAAKRRRPTAPHSVPSLTRSGGSAQPTGRAPHTDGAHRRTTILKILPMSAT